MAPASIPFRRKGFWSNRRQADEVRLTVDHFCVAVSLDAARIADGRAAEQHGVERGRAAYADRRLEQFWHFSLDEVEKSAPAGRDAVRLS